MKAMVLRQLGPMGPDAEPLVLELVPDPVPGPGQVLIDVAACGVCHTELDEIEGRTPPPFLPVILGHQVVGKVADRGPGAMRFARGDRVGVGWIFSACGVCDFCRRGLENLCAHYRATGRDANGGYAQKMVVPEAFAHPIPEGFSDIQAAPLFCAGAIGYRSLKLSGLQNGQLLGLTGFGASAHLVLKMVKHRYPDSAVFVFARSPAERAFALALGAAWAGDTAACPDQLLDAIIDTTPAWTPVVRALAAIKPAGRLVINAIRKEAGDKAALMELDYPAHLWLEKQVVSVANVASSDIAEFLELAAAAGIRPETQVFALAQANEALAQLKARKIKGAKVLVMDGSV